jgi:hypothetical protein
VCNKNNEIDKFHERWSIIKKHMEEGEFKYPALSNEENKAIRIIANNLYESIKTEFEQAVKLFEDLDKAFTKKESN